MLQNKEVTCSSLYLPSVDMKAGNDKTGFPKIVANQFLPALSLSLSLSLCLSLPSTKFTMAESSAHDATNPVVFFDIALAGKLC